MEKIINMYGTLMYLWEYNEYLICAEKAFVDKIGKEPYEANLKEEYTRTDIGAYEITYKDCPDDLRLVNFSNFPEVTLTI